MCRSGAIIQPPNVPDQCRYNYLLLTTYYVLLTTYHLPLTTYYLRMYLVNVQLEVSDFLEVVNAATITMECGTLVSGATSMPVDGEQA